MSEIEKTVETQAPESGKKKKKEKVKKTVGQEILSWVLTILVAVIAALIIRSVIFEPVRVDGASMDDTLANGEIMFVSKFDYSTTWKRRRALRSVKARNGLTWSSAAIPAGETPTLSNGWSACPGIPWN